MNNIRDEREQKAMPWLVFQVMRLVMNIRKPFRNIEEEINLAGIGRGFYILDFGCGLGFNTIPAAKAVGKEGQVFALDFNKQAIKIVEKKISKNSLDNVKLIESSCDTGLGNKSIDLVYLHNTLPMIKEKQKVLKEITRVIKTGGKLSYMSRLGSRVYGEDTFSDSRLKEILTPDFNLKKERNRHLIFERIS